MAWGTPPAWAVGDTVTEAKMDIVTDDLNWLRTPPSCRVYNNAAISHTTGAGAYQYLTFNSERFDTDTMHSTSSLTGRITFTQAGKYLVGGNIEWPANPTGQRGVNIRLNGATQIAAAPFMDATALNVAQCSVVTLYVFAAADYVELGAFQSSGGNLNVNATGNISPEFWAVWVSA